MPNLYEKQFSHTAVKHGLCMTHADEEKLRIFERKMIRKIQGTRKE